MRLIIEVPHPCVPENNNVTVLSEQLLLLAFQISVNYDNKGRDLELKRIHFIGIKKKKTQCSPCTTVGFVRRQQVGTPCPFCDRCPKPFSRPLAGSSSAGPPAPVALTADVFQMLLPCRSSQDLQELSGGERALLDILTCSLCSASFC